MNEKKRKVETFYCPIVELPEDFQGKNKKSKKLNDRNSNKERERERGEGREEINDREIFQKIFNSVRDFGTSNSHNSKKKSLDDKLTKLGAPPIKQQKMPFKMRVGILEGRKKREEYQKKEAKSSGQILAIKSKNSSKLKRKEKNLNQPDFDIKTKRGVLRLSKARLPTKLWKK